MRTCRARRWLVLAAMVAAALAAASCSNPAQTSAPSADAPPVTATARSGASGSPAGPSATTSAEAAGPTTTPTSPASSSTTHTFPQGTPASQTASATSPSAAPAGLRPVGLAGVNDPECRSGARPVVLLHGTFSTVASNFKALVPALQSAGRCVYGIDYGLGGTRPVTESARSVGAFVDTVLATAGADQVDIIGFSQGGLVLRTALQQDAMAGKVAVAALIAPSFHGTTSSLLDALPAGACPACADQAADSPLLIELNRNGDLARNVRYAVISTADDTVVTPVASQVPGGPPDRVRSLLVQDRCPGEHVDHIVMPGNDGVIAWTVAALETAGMPDPTALTCG